MYRAVEGQVHYWIVGIGNVIGSSILALTWDSYAQSLATNFPKLNLLAMFGNYGGLLVNYLLLVVFFIVIVILEKYYLTKKRKQFL